LFVCLSVFPHDVSKTDAARVTKLDTEYLSMSPEKTINFGVKRSKVTRHKNITGVCHSTLVIADFWFVVE